jgi:hypothetical protein
VGDHVTWSGIIDVPIFTMWIGSMTVIGNQQGRVHTAPPKAHPHQCEMDEKENI